MRLGPKPAPTVPPMVRNELVNPISNAPVVTAPADSEVPDRHEFEVMRQRRRVLELECIVRDRDDRIVKAIGMIEDELAFWRTYLHDHVGETMAGISRRVGRLESARDYMTVKGSRYYPPLEMPEGWKKKGP